MDDKVQLYINQKYYFRIHFNILFIMYLYNYFDLKFFFEIIDLIFVHILKFLCSMLHSLLSLQYLPWTKGLKGYFLFVISRGQQRAMEQVFAVRLWESLTLQGEKQTQLVESRGSRVLEPVGKLLTVMVTKNSDLGTRTSKGQSQGSNSQHGICNRDLNK